MLRGHRRNIKASVFHGGLQGFVDPGVVQVGRGFGDGEAVLVSGLILFLFLLSQGRSWPSPLSSPIGNRKQLIHNPADPRRYKPSKCHESDGFNFTASYEHTRSPAS